MRDRRYYCVYIMGSLTGTLYIGVSSNLHKRVFQHKFHHYEGFTARYEVVRLLCSNAAIRSGRTWPQSGTRGWSTVKAGMLRLRSEDRVAIPTSPLSMTGVIGWLKGVFDREGLPHASRFSMDGNHE